MPALYFRRARLRPFAAVAAVVALCLIAAGPALARPAGPTAAEAMATSLNADRPPAADAQDDAAPKTPDVDAAGLWIILGILGASGIIVVATRRMVSRPPHPRPDEPASAPAPGTPERPLDTTSATG
jgi:hypothetical protein